MHMVKLDEILRQRDPEVEEAVEMRQPASAPLGRSCPEPSRAAHARSAAALLPQRPRPLYCLAPTLYCLLMDLEITVDQLQQQLASEHPPLLLDVREPWEFQTAHIHDAKLMPMNEVPARAFHELDEDQPIAVLCHHGARSLSVANWLRQQGFEKAQSVAGGIDLWSRAIDPAVPRY